MNFWLQGRFRASEKSKVTAPAQDRESAIRTIGSELKTQTARLLNRAVGSPPARPLAEQRTWLCRSFSNRREPLDCFKPVDAMTVQEMGAAISNRIAALVMFPLAHLGYDQRCSEATKSRRKHTDLILPGACFAMLLCDDCRKDCDAWIEKYRGVGVSIGHDEINTEQESV